MPFPYFENAPLVSPPVVQELEGFLAKLTGWLKKEHTGSGGHGDITANSLTVKAGAYERGRRVAMGDWVEIAFNAADYTTDTGATWAVSNISSHRYALVGHTLHYTFYWGNSVITGTPPRYLRVALPAGYVCATRFATTIIYNQYIAPTENEVGYTAADVGESYLRISRFGPPSFAGGGSVPPWSSAGGGPGGTLTVTLEVK